MLRGPRRCGLVGGVQPGRRSAWPRASRGRHRAAVGSAPAGRRPGSCAATQADVCVGGVQSGRAEPGLGQCGRTVRLWDLRQPEAPRGLRGHEGGVGRWRSARTGKAWPRAVGTAPCGCGIWPAGGRGCPARPRRCGRVGGVQPGRAGLASGGEDGTVRLWDLRQPEAAPTCAATRVRSVGGVQSGWRSLASGGELGDGTVRLWDLRQPGRAHILRGHEGLSGRWRSARRAAPGLGR